MGGSESMRRLVAVFGAAMLVAVSCSSGTTTGGASPTVAATAAGTDKPPQGGRVIEATISDIATMQPGLVKDTAPGRITRLIYHNLIQGGFKNGRPQPPPPPFAG